MYIHSVHKIIKNTLLVSKPLNCCKMFDKIGFCYKACYDLVKITSFVQIRGRITNRYIIYSTSDNKITCTNLPKHWIIPSINHN